MLCIRGFPCKKLRFRIDGRVRIVCGTYDLQENNVFSCRFFRIGPVFAAGGNGRPEEGDGNVANQRERPVVLLRRQL